MRFYLWFGYCDLLSFFRYAFGFTPYNLVLFVNLYLRVSVVYFGM